MSSPPEPDCSGVSQYTRVSRMRWRAVLLPLLAVAAVGWAQNTSLVEVAETPGSAVQSFGDIKQREMDKEFSLLDELFNPSKGYKSYQRPPPEKSAYSSIIVFVNMQIAETLWNDDCIAELTIYWRQQWLDKRLAYADSDPDNLVNDELHIPTSDHKIWLPRTYFATSDVQDDENEIIIVDRRGGVRHSKMYTLTLYCDYHRSYPLVNKRLCAVDIGSYHYAMSDVIYMWRRAAQVQYNDVTIEFVNVYNCTTQYDLGEYSCIGFEVVYAFNNALSIGRLILPSLVLLFVSWLHVFVPVNWGPARAFSALLPVTVFATLMAGDMVDMDTPGTAVWYLGCLVFTFTSAVEYFVVLRRQHEKRRTRKHLEQQPLQEQTPAPPPVFRSRIDLFARVAWPIAFVLYVAFYLLFLLV